MTETHWTVRQAVLGFAWMMLGSSVLSGLVLFVLDATDGDVPMEDPRVLVGLVVATALGFCVGIAYGVRVAGASAFNWRPMTRKDTAFAVLAVAPALLIGVLWSELYTFLGGDTDVQVFVAGLLETTSQTAFVLSTLYAVLIAPILEELFFRGFMQPPLVRRFGAWGGIAIASLIFGVIHVVDPWSVIPVVSIGMIAGWLRHRSGGLGAPVVFHSLNNGVALILNAGLT